MRLVGRVGIALAWVGASFAVVVFAGLPVYVFPKTDKPRTVDAVFLLGPINTWNLRLGERYVEAGLASTLVLSTPTETGRGACTRTYVICFRPDPSTTQGEAQEFARLAEIHSWDSALVVTTTAHITRARMLMSRCFSGELLMVSYWSQYDISEWIHQYLYQTGAFFKAWLHPDC